MTEAPFTERRKSTLKAHVVGKASSARWLCTLGATIVFVYMAVADRFSNQEALGIIQMVFLFYFLQKQADDKAGNGSGNGGTP